MKTNGKRGLPHMRRPPRESNWQMSVGAQMVIVLKAFVEHCVMLVVSHAFDFSWLEVSQRDVFHCFLFLMGASNTAVADFSVIVSSNEARRILIQKSLYQLV